MPTESHLENSHRKLIVTGLCNSIRDEINAKIDSGVIPADWDGHELRSILADKFAREISTRMKTDRKRKRKYNNDIVVNNI
jgi:hypothetical protein